MRVVNKQDKNSPEKKYHSLERHMFKATLLACLIVGLVTLVIGLGLYSRALLDQYIDNTFYLSRNAADILQTNVEMEPFCRKVKATYDSMSEDERGVLGGERSEKWEAFDSDINYQKMIGILTGFLNNNENISDIYVAIFDRETDALVYIADPDTKDPRRIGDWEPVERRETEKFLNWNGEGRLYDLGSTEMYGWICTGGVPLRAEDGEIYAFVLTDITTKNVIRGMWLFAIQYLFAVAVLVFMLGLLMSKHMKKSLVRPINDIATAASKYVRDKKEGISAMDHFSSLDIHTGDEVENLSEVMADMENQLAEYEEHLTTAVAERERISTELELARRIQADMVPNVFPAFPERNEFDIYASMKPAKEVGGDFYNFFLIDDDHLALAIADVSGKGVPAALFMMVSIILVQNYTMSEPSPAEVLRVVNEQFCANNREDMFITIWLGILDLRTGQLTAANAGHEFPILKEPDGNFVLFKDKHGFVVGGMSNMVYQDYDIWMRPGSKLFLYTDGLAEAINEDNEMFGTGRIVKSLGRIESQSPKEIIEAVDRDVECFMGQASQFDDMTMLCLHYISNKSGD